MVLILNKQTKDKHWLHGKMQPVALSGNPAESRWILARVEEIGRDSCNRPYFRGFGSKGEIIDEQELFIRLFLARQAKGQGLGSKRPRAMIWSFGWGNGEPDEVPTFASNTATPHTES